MSATLRNFTNFELRGGLSFAKDYTEFPANPKKNELAVVNGVMWLYSTIDGSLSWYPLNNKKNTYTHTQGEANDSWLVEHGMGTENFLFGLYDGDGKLTYPADVADITEDSFRLVFTEPMVGRVVVFFDTEAFAPTVTTQLVNADELNVAGGSVTADSTGLRVNGNAVPVLDHAGQMDYGTL